MNLYRGCQHQCIYCDSRSLCYQIEDFSDILVKVNALELLERELASKRVKGTIGTGGMNDPYMPLEAEINLTGRALELMLRHRFPVHITTKSDLVLRDIDTIKAISEIYAAVSFTITTADDALARKLEPGAPPPSSRLQAMSNLANEDIYTGITLMPVLPFIEDNEANITDIVELARDSGASYIIPSFGMSLSDRQRAYYYDKLDIHFPGLRSKYEERFGEQYHCPASNAEALEKVFIELCNRYGIDTRMKTHSPDEAEQLALL